MVQILTVIVFCHAYAANHGTAPFVIVTSDEATIVQKCQTLFITISQEARGVGPEIRRGEEV